MAHGNDFVNGTAQAVRCVADKCFETGGLAPCRYKNTIESECR